MQDSTLKEGDLVAIIDTKFGSVKLKLFNEVAPLAAANFIGLAKSGYYNSTIFHRVINGFMIQGGDPTGTGSGGMSIYGKEFKDERVPGLIYVRGALCMANSGPNTNGSQFFIFQSQKPLQLAGFYTIFGHVIEGMETVDQIAAQKTDRSDRPLEEITIDCISIWICKSGSLEMY